MEKRIVVSGYYGAKNAGDEAMLAAMLEVLRDLDPKLHITVISASPKDTAERHGVEAVSWISLPAIFDALTHADILLSGGGSLLQNVTSRRSLYYYLAIIFLARMLGKRVMLYAQGIGPIIGHVAETAMRFVLRGVDCITVRDKGSLEELMRLGIQRPKTRCTADPVLAIHPVTREAGRTIFDAYHVREDLPVVGISVRDWQHEQAFKQVFAEVSDRIVRELGAQVVFLPMQFPEDVRAAKSIAERTHESCAVLAGEYTTAEFLSLVGNMDLMLGIRLHALIFAGVMNVPRIGISYDPKVDRFLASIGERPVGNLRTITVEALMKAVHTAWDQRRGREHTLPMKLRELAAENAHMALELIYD